MCAPCRRSRCCRKNSEMLAARTCGEKKGQGQGDGYSHDHLLATQQRVADELASSQGNGSLVVRHGCGCAVVEVSGWVIDEGGRQDGGAFWGVEVVVELSC